MYPRSAPSLFLPSSFSTASAPTEIYTLSLHDALPILSMRSVLELIEQHDLVLFALDRANFGQLRCDHGCVTYQVAVVHDVIGTFQLKIVADHIGNFGAQLESGK